ncbi:MAG: hypothetical protein ACOC2C_05745, partial [Cyclonatronaceae bacterium]
MKTRKNPSNILTPSFAFTYVGLIGLVIFLLLRPSFDFNANARFHISAEDAQERLYRLNQRLGLEADSLTMEYMATRFQDTALFNLLEAQASAPLRPRQLNGAHVPINGWEVIAGEKSSATSFLLNQDDVFRNYGVSRATLDNRGRIISFEHQTGREDGFVSAKNELSYVYLQDLIQEVFEYDVSAFYPLAQPPGIEAELPPSTRRFEMSGQQPRPVTIAPELPDSAGTFIMRRHSSVAGGPVRLELDYEIITQNGQAGTRINAFHAHFIELSPAADEPGSAEAEAEAEAESAAQDTTILNLSIRIVGILLLALIVFGTAIRQIFLGRMEWKRSLFIFVSFTIALWLIRITFFYPTFYQFISTGIVAFDFIQQFLISGLVGLYGAFAYIAWESLAREF